jgi:hypothetical protein
MSTQINISMTEQAEAVRAEARIIANFAWQHMRASATFRNQVRLLEAAHANAPMGDFFLDIRTYASACIASAASAMEALINELFINPNDPLRQGMPDFEEAFWGQGGVERKPILEKYQLALGMLGRPKIDKNSVIYRDAWALIELRNSLIHYKPTWDPDRQKKINLIEFLQGKFELSPFVQSENDFVSERCMSAGCAGWVVSTVAAFIGEFNSRAQIDPNKVGQFFIFGE